MVVYQSLIQKKGEGRQHKAGASAKYLCPYVRKF